VDRGLEPLLYDRLMSADGDLTSALRAISETIPFNRLLGLEVTAFSVDGCTVEFDRRPEHVGNVLRDVLHGGVISSAVDFVGGMTALATMVRGAGITSIEELGRMFARFGTIDLRVDYLRPGAGTHFVATGTALRTGRRVAVTRMELRNEEGTLIAVGTGSYATG
jgi:uncharacterized protein (TIGR00369 family)